MVKCYKLYTLNSKEKARQSYSLKCCWTNNLYARCAYVFMNIFCVQSVMTIFHTLFLKIRFFSRFFSLCHSSRNFECLQKELGRLVYFSQFDAKIFTKCKAFNGEDEGEAGERNKR